MLEQLSPRLHTNNASMRNNWHSTKVHIILQPLGILSVISKHTRCILSDFRSFMPNIDGTQKQITHLEPIGHSLILII